jgi:hypothetical protein
MRFGALLAFDIPGGTDNAIQVLPTPRRNVHVRSQDECPKRSDLTMRTSSISRSKMFTTEPVADSWPDIPLLDTEDLPSEADWAFLKSLCFDQADVCDVGPDIDQLTHSSIERADFD